MQHVSEESASQSNETNDLPELSRYRAPTVPNRYMGPSVQHGMPPVYPSAGVLQHPPVAAQVRTHVVRDVLHQLCIPQLPSGFTSKIPIPYLSLIPRIFEIEGILGTGITSTVYSATVHPDAHKQYPFLSHTCRVALKVLRYDVLPYLSGHSRPCVLFHERSTIYDIREHSLTQLQWRLPEGDLESQRISLLEETNLRDILDESFAHRNIQHPNIVRLHFTWLELFNSTIDDHLPHIRTLSNKSDCYWRHQESARTDIQRSQHICRFPPTSLRYSICLAMELCEGISLEEYFEYLMRSTQRTHRVERQANVHEGCQTQSSTAHRVVRLHVVDEPMIRHILGQLIAALYHLHHVQNVIHRDLKPENIMLCGFDPRRIAQSDDADPNTSVNGESAWILKLIDFGCSMRLMYGSEILQDYIGTVPYMSPQVVTTSAYTTKTDMWSLGVILYEMLLGMSPFSEVRTGDDMRSALARWVKPKSLVPLDDSGKAQPLPPDLAEMCLQLLEKEERKRPSAKKLLRRFPWCRAYLQPEDAVGYLDRWL